MNSKFEELNRLGAGEFEHLNGSLLDHLNATYALLKQWRASPALCDAGLYHAAYGTDGFDEKVVSLSHREKIANIIGKEAEAIVYLYCSCDREYVFTRIGKSERIQFKDRFNSEEFILNEQEAKHFCELTVANELELVIASDEFANAHGKSLYDLFRKLTPFLSQLTITARDQILKSFS